MSEVRILARTNPRPTGIPRTSTQVPRDMSGNAASHVSASPAAGAYGQAQVLEARRSALARPDVTVTLVDRRAPAGASPGGSAPPTAVSQHPIVQIVDRTRPAAASSLFTLDHLMLMAHLLDQYRENTRAINDGENAAIADGALNVLAILMPTAGPSAPPASPEPLTSAPPGETSSWPATDLGSSPVTGPSASPVGDAVSR